MFDEIPAKDSASPASVSGRTTRSLGSKRDSPANTRLLSHVHSLIYFLRGSALTTLVPSTSFVTIFSHFFQLKTLTFRHPHIEPTVAEHLRLFSVFLSSLSLGAVSIAWGRPSRSSVSFYVDDKPVPNMSHPRRGRLLVELRPEYG